MIKNYFKTAWRSLIRNKSYTAINIVGLAVGIAACLLIFLVIHFETSFDDFHKKTDHEISVPDNSAGTLKKFDEDGIYFVEPQFFKVFDYDWLSGDENTALNEPNTVV